MHKWERLLVYTLVGVCLSITLWTRYSVSCNTLRKLTIVNKQGKPAISLVASDISGSGLISLYGPDNDRTATLGKAGLCLYAPGEKEQVWIGPSPGENSSGMVELFDNDRQLLTKIGGRQYGGFVEFFSKKGMPLAILGGVDVPVGESFHQVSAGGLATYGFRGKPIAALGISIDGSGSLTLWDKDLHILSEYP